MISDKKIAVIGSLILIVVGGIILFPKNKISTPDEKTALPPINQKTLIGPTSPPPTGIKPPTVKTSNQPKQTHTVHYKDGVFTPSTLEINLGDTVTFVSDSGKLWVASDPHPGHTDLSNFDADMVTESYSYTFLRSGTFSYHNHVSSSSQGTIKVR